MFGTFYVSCSKEIDMTTNLQFHVEMFNLGRSQVPKHSSCTTKCSSSFHGIKHTRSFHNLKCYNFFQYQVTMYSSPPWNNFFFNKLFTRFLLLHTFQFESFSHTIITSLVQCAYKKESKVLMFESGVNRHPNQRVIITCRNRMAGLFLPITLWASHCFTLPVMIN
jgi:hypothetical protein